MLSSWEPEVSRIAEFMLTSSSRAINCDPVSGQGSEGSHSGQGATRRSRERWLRFSLGSMSCLMLHIAFQTLSELTDREQIGLRMELTKPKRIARGRLSTTLISWPTRIQN